MDDKDFSRVQFRINVSGSWANLINVDGAKYEDAKTLLEKLVAMHDQPLSPRLRALDADGGVIEQYGFNNGQMVWRAPR